jgi:hypothetical protein
MAANTHAVFTFFQDVSLSSKKLLSKCKVCQKTLIGKNISNLKKHLKCTHEEDYQMMEQEEKNRIRRIRTEFNFAIVARGQRCLNCSRTFADTSLRSLKNHLRSQECNFMVSEIVFFNIVLKIIDFNQCSEHGCRYNGSQSQCYKVP